MAELSSATHENVTVESYTDTPDQLRAALGLDQQPDTKPAETPEPDTADTDDQPTSGEPPAESAAGKTLAEKRQKLQKRIDGLTWQTAQTARERDDLRAKADRLERELAAVKAPTTGNGKPEPTAGAPTTERFPKYAEYLHAHPDAELEEWMEARDDWRDARRDAQVRVREQTDQQAHRLSERAQQFSTHMQTALHADPDLVTKIDPRLMQTKALSALEPHERPTFGNFLVEQILKSDQPAALLLHLSNEQEVQRLASLEPDLVIRELAHIESRAGAAPGGSAPAPSIKSQAKPPVKPLGGSPQPASDEPDDDASAEEHFNYWNAKELAARRRRG